MSEFNNLISMLNDKNDIILSQQAKIDELQARIDSLTNINESLVAYKNQLLDEIEEKGNKDENWKRVVSRTL